jgi:hypothetical protein
MKGITAIWVLALLAAVIAGCGRSTGISKDSFERIEDDMTKAEVLAILGDPTGSEVVAERNGKKIMGSVWQATGIKIVIAFSSSGELSMKSIEMD